MAGSKPCVPPPEGKKIIYSVVEGYDGEMELHTAEVEKFSGDGEYVHVARRGRATNFNKRILAKYCCFSKDDAIIIALAKLQRKKSNALSAIRQADEDIAKIESGKIKERRAWQ